MDVLLSIKPKHVSAIKSGSKHYEFRKRLFRKPVEKVYIYTTSPIQKISGYFHVGEIIENQPKSLWDELKDLSGMNETEFFDYFGTKNTGFAIQIIDAVFFDIPIDPYCVIPNFSPPQSLRYINISDLCFEELVPTAINRVFSLQGGL